MTTTDIYARFRSLYQERSTRYFDTTWAVELINDAIDELDAEISALNPEYFGTKSGNLSSVVDQQEYDAPDDFGKIISVLIKDKGGPPYPRLSEIQYYQKDSRASDYPAADWMTGGGKGEPYSYYLHQKQSETGVQTSNITIGFVPIWTRAATNNVEIIYRAKRTLITAINATSWPNIPDEWHALVPYVMCVLAATADESPRLVYYEKRYMRRFALRLGEGLRGRGESQESIESVDSD